MKNVYNQTISIPYSNSSIMDSTTFVCTALIVDFTNDTTMFSNNL